MVMILTSEFGPICSHAGGESLGAVTHASKDLVQDNRASHAAQVNGS